MDRPSRLSQDENRLLEDYYVAYYRMPRHNTVVRDVETIWVEVYGLTYERNLLARREFRQENHQNWEAR